MTPEHNRHCALIVHVGLHKTGSTSFQRACHNGREKLLSHGIYYPPWPEGAGFLSSHSDLSSYITAGRMDELKDYCEAQIAQARKYEARAVLLSSEDFSTLWERPQSFDAADAIFLDVFGGATYCAVLRNINAVTKSRIRERLMHSGAALMELNYKGLSIDPERIFLAVDFFANRLATRFRYVDYEELARDGRYCNNLLGFCIGAGGPNNLLTELRKNTSQDKLKQLTPFMMSTFRAALAMTGNLNPYSMQIDRALKGKIDEDKLARAFTNREALAELAEAVDQAITIRASHICKLEGRRLLRKYSNRPYASMLIAR